MNEADINLVEGQKPGGDKAAPGSAPQAAGDVMGKVAVRLLPFMFLLYIAAYLDRINVSFAGLQMNKDLGFSDSVFGLGAGIFFLGYFLFGIPSNLMVERLGARRWIASIMVVWGLISMSMIFVQSEVMFYSLRFLLGVAEAGFFPGMILYLTYWFPKREHGLAVARFMTAVPAAGVLGGLISSRVLTLTGFFGLAGWKWLFLMTGSLSFLLGFCVSFVLSDGPDKARWLTPDERAWLAERLASDRKLTDAGRPVSLADGLASPRVWLMAGIYFLITLSMYGFQLWLPQIIRGFGGMSDSTTALLSAVPALFQALGMLAIAALSDGSGKRRRYVAVSAVIAALGLAATGLTSNSYAALAALSVAAFGIWGTVGPFWALPTGYLPPQAAAAGIALINSVGNLGGFVGPYAIGLIKSHTQDFSLSLFALAGVLIAAAALVFVVKTDGTK